MKTEVNPLKTEPLTVVAACIAELESRDNASCARPLEPALLESLRLNGKQPPASLKKYLAYDCTFKALCSQWGAFSQTEPMADKPGHWPAVPPEAAIVHLIELLAEQPVEKLKLLDSACQPISNPMAYLKISLSGQLFQLPTLGDQSHFLYVGVADSQGEYPVLALEMQGEIEDEDENAFWGQFHVWIKYPSFAAFLYDQIFDTDIDPQDFASQTVHVYENNPELAGK